MVFPTCIGLVSYKAPMKPSHPARTLPCVPLCIVLLFGLSAFPVFILIQISTLWQALSWRSWSTWALVWVGLWTRWHPEVPFNLNYAVICVCVCVSMCSQWNEKWNNIHWENGPTQSKGGDSSVWKSCPAHQNSMVHLTSNRFLPLLFPKTPHSLPYHMTECMSLKGQNYI